jgi:hypothetical protein
VGPPRTTVDMKPAFCSARERRRWRFVDGIEVSPSRALEAFWRWEHVCARSTRDISSDSEIAPVRSEVKMGKCKLSWCR